MSRVPEGQARLVPGALPLLHITDRLHTVSCRNPSKGLTVQDRIKPRASGLSQPHGTCCCPPVSDNSPAPHQPLASSLCSSQTHLTTMLSCFSTHFSSSLSLTGRSLLLDATRAFSPFGSRQKTSLSNPNMFPSGVLFAPFTALTTKS